MRRPPSTPASTRSRRRACVRKKTSGSRPGYPRARSRRRSGGSSIRPRPPASAPGDRPGVEDLGQRQVLAAGPDRKFVVEVAQHRLVTARTADAAGQFAAGEDLLPVAPRSTGREGGGARWCTSRRRTSARAAKCSPSRSNGPELGVVGQQGGDGHVVGDDVGDQMETVCPRGRDQASKPARPPFSTLRRAWR